MRTSSKAIITASFVLPMFLVACDRAERSPTTGSGSSQEKMNTNQSAPPATPLTEKSSPSPADVSKNPMAPSSSAPSTSETAPADQKNEEKKGY